VRKKMYWRELSAALHRDSVAVTNQNKRLQWVTGAALTGILLVTASCARTNSQTPAATAEPPPQATSPARILPHPALSVNQSGVSISDVAERALPSVVNIALTKVSRTRAPRSPFFDDPMFRHFFGPPGGGEPRERREQGLGSGVIVSRDGIVLTNNHVVEGADEIKVTTSDRREFEATVVGSDPKSDLAVIKLKGDVSSLSPVEIGDSSQLRLGDVVLAIGNPFGVGQTVTMGIVSAKGRADVGIVDYEDFIQTDAAINPGNSGGALINMEGKLVGINTAILSRTGGYMGIGFAIPSNMARPIMESLQKHGRVVRGWLGVGIQDIDQELARALNLPSRNGVLISEVSAGSPAARAGVQRGDVVLKVDGRGVDSAGQLRNAIAAAGAQKKVRLDILRDGKPLALDVGLGEMPQEVAGGDAPASGNQPAARSLDGLTLENLNDLNRKRFQIPSDVGAGVVVLDVARGSAAARAGLRPGDVLLEVNKQRIEGVEKFKDVYGRSKGATLLVVSRQGRTIYMVVRR
jgi:serine protease Do